MQKIPPSDRTYFSLGEKSCNGNRAELFPQQGGVMVRYAEEPLPAATATK